MNPNAPFDFPLTPAQMPPSVVQASPGPSPGANGFDALPSDADYILKVVGTGIGAVNMKTGNTDYSVGAGDHAPVFQSAANALLTAGGPTGGRGGCLKFKGNPLFASQLVLNPNISLVGQGRNSYKAGGVYYGPVIVSTYNGSCILVTGDSRASTFVEISGFALYGGGSSLASQNGIEWNASGGQTVLDTALDRLFITNMGAHGLLLGGVGAKQLIHRCWIEFNSGSGISQGGSGGTLFANQCYLTGNTLQGYDGSGAGANNTVLFSNTTISSSGGIGFINPAGASYWEYKGGLIGSCTGGGMEITSPGPCEVDTAFLQNGGGATPQLLIPSASFASSRISVRSRFNDGRGSGNVVNHAVLAGTAAVFADFAGSTFYGSSGDAVAWTSLAGNRIIIKNCLGYSDVKGKIATPFGSGRIGAAGTAANPTASTTYATEGTDLYVVSTGGVGVSITITDAAANVVQAGLLTFSGILPIGYSINFGAFTGAPAVYVGVT